MKRFLLLCIAAFVFGKGIVHAQEAPAKPPRKVFVWDKKTMNEIGVSAEVQAKVEGFKKQNDAEQKALRESDEFKKATEEEQKKRMGALLGKRHKTIYEMLTKEEQSKVDEMREKIRKENEANGYK